MFAGSLGGLAAAFQSRSYNKLTSGFQFSRKTEKPPNPLGTLWPQASNRNAHSLTLKSLEGIFTIKGIFFRRNAMG